MDPTNDDAPEVLNPGHYFQLLDRVHVASLYLQTVFEHDPVLALHPEMRAKFDHAVELLEQLYQEVGQHDFGVPGERGG
ncbi:MAG: hypothetical protein R3F29_13740 [Planctomycetota bacterium]